VSFGVLGREFDITKGPSSATTRRRPCPGHLASNQPHRGDPFLSSSFPPINWSESPLELASLSNSDEPPWLELKLASIVATFTLSDVTNAMSLLSSPASSSSPAAMAFGGGELRSNPSTGSNEW
jgi:hypothetical protein